MTLALVVIAFLAGALSAVVAYAFWRARPKTWVGI